MKKLTTYLFIALLGTACNSDKTNSRQQKEFKLFSHVRAKGFKGPVKTVTQKYYANTINVDSMYEPELNSFAHSITYTFDQQGYLIRDRFANMYYSKTNKDTTIKGIFYKYQNTDTNVIAEITGTHIVNALIKTFKKINDSTWEQLVIEKGNPSMPLEQRYIVLNNRGRIYSEEYWLYHYDTITREPILYKHEKETYRYSNNDKRTIYVKQYIIPKGKTTIEQYDIVEQDKYNNPTKIIITSLNSPAILDDVISIKLYTYEYYD